MAGFLIVEGDVDDAIMLAMTGVGASRSLDTHGQFDYRERHDLRCRRVSSSVDLQRTGQRTAGASGPSHRPFRE
jgi:hypothetical protein